MEKVQLFAERLKELQLRIEELKVYGGLKRY